MPNTNYIDSIFERLNHPNVPASPNHFLFLLGTDTVFIPRPTANEEDPVKKRYYERGETLSYAAQAVVSLMGEEGACGPKGNPLSYTSPSVEVLNGPTTRGLEVGQRIAQGILLALNAIASGKSNLQITAHSRGAVEAILIMHELERIKKALQAEPLKTLYQILMESPCKYTRTAMKEFITNGDESEALRAVLATQLENVKINPFLIDPVPGGRVFKLPNVAWRDPRFYQPVRHNKSELVIARDERTGAFIPVIPEGMQPIIIPGHHGTASGNQYTQQYEDVPHHLQNRDTTAVQDLVLCRLFNFFGSTTDLFENHNQELYLGHDALDKLTNAFIQATPLERQQLLLKKYNVVMENDGAYRAFNKTYYNYILGTENIDGHRMVHLHGHNYKRLSECSASMPEASFVNHEHAMLFLSDILGTDISHQAKADALVTLITWAVGNITSEAVVNDPDDRFETLISTEAGRKIFFKGLAVLIDTISQQYLRNHLSPEDKARLMVNISAPFTTLLAAKNNPDIQDKKEIIEECEKILQQGLKQTVETHYKSILEQAKRVHHQVQLFLDPTTLFADVFKTYLTSLVTNDSDIQPQLDEIKARLSRFDPERVDDIQQVLSEISEEIGGSSLQLAQQEKLNELLFGPNIIQLNDYFEAYQWSIEKYLGDIEQIYNAVIELKSASPRLRHLVRDKPWDIEPEQLFMIENSLPALAGKILQMKGYDLRHPIASISREFYDVAKNQAIACGASSPEHIDLERRFQEQNTTLLELGRDKEELELEKSEQAQTINRLEQQNQEKDSAFERLKQRDAQYRSVKERGYDLLIQDKLIPITADYLHYLLTEAKAYCDSIDCEDCEQNLPEPSTLTLNHASIEAYSKIKHKLDVVQNLYWQLTSVEIDDLPSQRIETFKSMLNDSENDLKLHRDPAWLTFTKACFSVIAFILTGMIPGLLYSTLTGRSPLFFTKSHGAIFVDDCNTTLNAKK